MTVDMRLVSKGKSEPRKGLIEQGKVHVTLAKQYAEALIESGWSSEDSAQLEKNVALIESATGVQQAETSGVSEDESEQEAIAIDEAKVLIRRLRNALPRTLRETKTEGAGAEMFETGEKLGRSVQRISAYLAKIRPRVESLDEDLKRHFGGKKVSELLDSAKSTLDHAETTQESGQANVPDGALAYYELKGRVLEGIEDLNRAGRIAFEGQAEVVGKFNKDILLRARRERTSKDPRPSMSPEASGTGGS